MKRFLEWTALFFVFVIVLISVGIALTDVSFEDVQIHFANAIGTTQSAGGTSGQIQYCNSAKQLAGSSNLTYEASTGITYVATEDVLSDIYTAPLTNYSSSTLLVGITGATTSLYYKKLGKTVEIYFKIYGTGSGATTEFTLPFNNNASSEADFALSFTSNNGLVESANGWGALSVSTNEVHCYRAGTNLDTWSGTAIRSVYGQFLYETN